MPAAPRGGPELLCMAMARDELAIARDSRVEADIETARDRTQEAVDAARSVGIGWAQIGEVLGIAGVMLTSNTVPVGTSPPPDHFVTYAVSDPADGRPDTQADPVRSTLGPRCSSGTAPGRQPA